MKTQMMVFCLAFVACGAYAQHDHASSVGTQQKGQNPVKFKEAKMGDIYGSYIQLKDALIASNNTEAKKAAEGLQKAMNGINGQAKAQDALAQLVKASDISGQRKAFSVLSQEIAQWVKGGKLTSGVVYLEYCPMANNHEGAYWLSNEKEIKNPYFGEKMLKCGSVKETIQ